MIKIVTDSSVNLDPELIAAYDIVQVPLSVMVDGVIYSDLDLKEEGVFSRLMASGKNLPKTSQPPVGLFADTYERLAKSGAQHIIAIHLASSLSGTVEASRQGAQLAGVAVTVVDSAFADQALGFQVLEAAQLAKDGADVETILSALEVTRAKTDLYLGLASLENLVKGGRVSRVSGLIGSLLNIRVVMRLKDSELHPVLKGRGVKTFNRWFEEFQKKLTQEPVRELAISYSGAPDYAFGLKAALEDVVSVPIRVAETGSIIQTHTGPGAFAIMVRYD